MELVDKWETEDKINDSNRNDIARYFELFEEHISPKSNALIAIVELKRLFQETLSLEDFHTKALWLVKEAEYPKGAIWNRVLQDTIISGLASDKIRAKVIKEGKDVTLTRVMEIACLEVSTQKHLDRMQETAKVNYVQYGKGSKGKKRKPKTSGNSGSSASAEERNGSHASAGEAKSKDKKPPLPTDICWRCGKARHQKGQICKALESTCRNCGIKGHYEKVCMKKSAHLVDVPQDSTDSEPLYYSELGEPVYAQTYAVQVNARNRNQHLIQLPVSVNLEKMRKQTESCPTILLKIDTGADVNLLNSTTSDQVIGNRSILQPSTLEMENYGSSRIVVLGKFFAFVRWKGKIYRQPFFVATANTSPNLLSRDACYALGVVKPCYAMEEERSNLQADLQDVADLQKNLQRQCNLQGNQPQIYSIEANTSLSDEKLKHRSSDKQQRPDTDLKQRSRHSTSTQNTAQIYRSMSKFTRSAGSTTKSTMTKRKQPQANSVANTVDSISHAYFISSFQNRTEVEKKQMRQHRGAHNNYRQMKDPDLQTDLQLDLQKDLPLNLQVKMDLQLDLQGLEGTQPSSLVSFPLQAETSTEERSTSMGGTCKQGPNHVSGELIRIYKDLHHTRIYNRDLHLTQIYNKPHQLTGHTPPHLRNRLRCRQQQQHPAPPMGNPVTPPVV